MQDRQAERIAIEVELAWLHQRIREKLGEVTTLRLKVAAMEERAAAIVAALRAKGE